MAMLKRDIHDSASALAYITDCTLSTVADLAMKKSRSVYELDRQIGIAQTGYDWMVQMGVDFSTTRAQTVKDNHGGSVLDWARKFDVLKRL